MWPWTHLTGPPLLDPPPPPTETALNPCGPLGPADPPSGGNSGCVSPWRQRSGSPAGTLRTRVASRCSTTGSGAPCATTTSAARTQRWCAGSWGTALRGTYRVHTRDTRLGAVTTWCLGHSCQSQRRLFVWCVLSCVQCSFLLSRTWWRGCVSLWPQQCFTVWSLSGPDKTCTDDVRRGAQVCVPGFSYQRVIVLQG